MNIAMAVLIAFVPLVQVGAQTNALSLEQAKEIAAQRNWDLLAAKSGVDSATAQLIVAKEFPNPTASLSTVKIGTHDSSTSLGNGIWDRNYDSIAAINQLFEVAGKRHQRQLAARAGVWGARARFYDARRTLDQGVTKAYMAALLAEDDVHIYNQSSGYLQQQARIAQDRYKAGDISESDKAQIEINAGQYELQAKAAEAAAVQARVAVEVLMGVKEPRGQWTPAQGLTELMGKPALPSPPRGGAAGTARSDVLAAQADLQSAEANLRLQKALRVPDPTVLIQGEHNPPGGGPAVNTLGVGVSFPIPIWNRNRGNIRAAEASVAQAQIALEKVQAQVVADTSDAQSAYQEAFARWKRYRDELGPKSTSVRESVAFAYEKGGASLVNLLDAERTDNDVRLATAQAMSDTASAEADLVAARRVLSETEIKSEK